MIKNVEKLVVLVLVVLVPFSNIIDILFPLPNISGKSFWVAAPVIALASVGLLRLMEYRRIAVYDVRMWFFFVLMALLVLGVRTVIYKEYMSLFPVRYIFTYLLYAYIAQQVIKINGVRLLLWGVVIQGGSVALRRI